MKKEKKSPLVKNFIVGLPILVFSPEEATELGLTEEEHLELSEGLSFELLKEVFEKKDLDLGIKTLTKNFSRFFARRNDRELAYQIFKFYYDEAGMELTREDAEGIRLNMLSLAKKLMRDQQEELGGVQDG